MEPFRVEQVASGTFGAGQVKKRFCLKGGHQSRVHPARARPSPVRIEIALVVLSVPQVQQRVGGAAVKADQRHIHFGTQERHIGNSA